MREILDNAENSLLLKQRNKKMSQVVGVLESLILLAGLFCRCYDILVDNGCIMNPAGKPEKEDDRYTYTHIVSDPDNDCLPMYPPGRDGRRTGWL
jgi:hypothetical protein